MFDLRNAFKSFLKYITFFSLLRTWSNFGALTALASFACGICIVHNTPLRSILLQKQLYPFFVPFAIICSISGIIAANKGLRLAFFAAAGALWYFVQAADMEKADLYISESAGRYLKISGNVISQPEPRRKGFAFLLSVKEVDGKRHPYLSGKVFLCSSRLKPNAYGAIELKGIMCSAEMPKNRYEFDERSFFAANGIAGKITVSRICVEKPPATFGGRLAARFRLQLVNVFNRYRNPEHRAVIRASFTGEKAYIDSDVKEAFRRSGLYHLLALSGFHAALLLSAFYFFLTPIPICITLKHIIVLSALWLYLAFVGPIPSLTRAVIMAGIVIVSMMLQRKNYPLQAIGIAGLIWLAFSPLSLFQPGFLLSFGATFGIITINPLIADLFPRIKAPVADFFVRPLFMSLSISISAFLMTMPILLYFFGYVSLYGIIANIAAVPLMSCALWSFFVALIISVSTTWVPAAIIAFSGKMIGLLLAIAKLAEKIPFILIRTYSPPFEIIAAFYCLILAVICIDKQRKGKIVIIGLPVFLCLIPADCLLRRALAVPTIIGFETPTAAAVTAVRWPRGNTWIFCGGKKNEVRNVLRYSVEEWARHVPGTTIERLFISPDNSEVIDSSPKNNFKRLLDVESYKIINPSFGCTCSFIPAGSYSKLLVNCKKASVVSDRTFRIVKVILAEDSSAYVAYPPLEILLRKRELRIRRFI